MDVRFFLGGGWSTLWYLLLYLLLLYQPILFGRELIAYARKGPGPEGLGIWVMLLLEATYVGFFTLVNATAYVWRQPMGVGQKVLIVLAGGVGLPLLVVLGGIPLGDGKVWGFHLWCAVIGAAVLLNLWWLHGAHGR